MKNIILSFFLLSSLTVAAQEVEQDVMHDQVWVYPILVAEHQLLEEKGGTNHFLNSSLVVDRDATKMKVQALKAKYPSRTVSVYRLDYVDAYVALPGLPNFKLSYSPAQDGWIIKGNYQQIPNDKLKEVKEFIKVESPLKVKLSHWRRNEESVVVMNESCIGDTGEDGGVLWLYERLKGFEKTFDALRTQSKLDKRKSMTSFIDKCVEFDADGAKSFNALTGMNRGDWRVKPVATNFKLSETIVANHFVEFDAHVVNQSSIVLY